MPDVAHQLEMLDDLADRLEDLETRYGKKPAKHDVAKLIEARLDPLTNVLEASHKTLKDIQNHIDLHGFQAIELNKTIQRFEAVNKGLAQQISKAFTPMMETIERLDASVSRLSKGMKDTTDHATQAIQADLKMVLRAIEVVDALAKGMQAAAGKVTETITALANAARLKKRGYRNPDGSWTLEPLDKRLDS